MAHSSPVADPIVRVSAGVSLVAVDTDWVLIDETTCRIEAVNETGALLWQCLDGTSPLGEICVDLADAFDADPRVVRADVAPVIDRLIELRFVHSGDDDASMAGARAQPETDP